VDIDIIVGSEGSLGKEIVAALLLNPETIVIGFDLHPTAKIINNNYYYLSGSVNSELDVEQLRRLIARVQLDSGELKNLRSIVNCFAMQDFKFSVEELPKNFPESEWVLWGWRNYPASNFVDQFETNVTGIHRILTQLYECYSESDNCSIINFCSQYAHKVPNQDLFKNLGKFIFKPPGYSVSKAAIENYTKYLATVFQGKGIRVNSIAPGSVDLGQSEEFRQKYSKSTISGRMMHSDEVVKCVEFLISPSSSYMNGSCLVADGGWSIK